MSEDKEITNKQLEKGLEELKKSMAALKRGNIKNPFPGIFDNVFNKEGEQ